MRVDTPTATLGIRGTFVTVDVSSVDGHTVASLGLETNLTTGEQFAGAFTLTNRITGNQVNVNSVNSMFSVSPAGTISESTKPPAIAAIEQASFQALSAIAAATAAGMGTGPTGPTQYLNDPNSPSGTKPGDTGPGSGPAPGGSGGANTAPTNTSPNDNHPTTTTSTTTHVDTPPANTGPTNIPNNTNQTNTPLALNQTNALSVSDIKPTVAPTDTTKIVDDHNGSPVTQPVTVTVATNHAPVINGGPIVASVQEDGGTASRATGQLTATDPDQTDTQTWTVVGGSSPHAPNYQFKIDEFKVVKTGTNPFTFDHTFTGNTPPAAPSYFVTGTFPSDGTGPGAALDGNNAGFGTGSPPGDPFFGQYATLNTNIDPANTTSGLKDNSSFTVSGVFDLILPQEDRNEYGIRLSDRTANQAGDSTVELRVTRDPGGIERVQLREIDFSSHLSTVLQSFTLNPGSHDHIQLSLAYDPAHLNVVQASFELEQNGTLDESTLRTFNTTGTLIFNNENWTRAQLFAEAPAQSDSVLQGTYGQLDITQAGAWTYQLANGQANVQALAAGVTVQDIFTAQVADGHGGFDTKTITVNVTGTKQRDHQRGSGKSRHWRGDRGRARERNRDHLRDAVVQRRRPDRPPLGDRGNAVERRAWNADGE